MDKSYLLTKEEFLAFKAEWSRTQNTHSVSDHVIYNLLSSKPLDCGFVAKKKVTKFEDPWYAFNDAKREAIALLKFANSKELKIFGLVVTDKILADLEKQR